MQIMEKTTVLERDEPSSDTPEVSYMKSNSPFQNYAYTHNSNTWASYKMPIMNLYSDKYKLKKTIFVQVESYQGGYLVSDEDVDRYGVGNTINDALIDYELDLIDYFECLNEHYPKLSKQLMDDLKYINQIITRV